MTFHLVGPQRKVRKDDLEKLCFIPMQPYDSMTYATLKYLLNVKNRTRGALPRVFFEHNTEKTPWLNPIHRFTGSVVVPLHILQHNGI